MKNSFIKKINRGLIALVILLVFGTGVCFAVTKVANDPTRLAVGAAPLGMGKAFLEMDSDISSMFINPAGLADVGRWQFTSMAGKFINEINYFNMAGAYPLSKGTISVGYIGSGLSFISTVGTLDTVDGVRIIPSSSEGSNYNYYNNVMLISYGLNLKDIVSYDLVKHISAGTTVKLFSQSLSGPGIVGGTASGYDMDFGVIYKPDLPFSLNAVAQNALPFDLGGKVSWTSGVVESIPSTLKLGTNIKILGEKGIRKLNNHELIFALDYDATPTRQDVPSLWHAGLQWTPFEMIQIRMGVDQDLVGNSVGLLEAANNFTAGVGFLWNGARFDYAFHQYYSVVDNNTHYFSFSYGIGKNIPEPKKKIEILSPVDKSVIYSKEVLFQGVILSNKVKYVTVNNVEAAINGSTFEVNVPLMEGKNGFVVLGLDDKNREIERVMVRVLGLPTFKDIPDGYWARLSIGQMSFLDIITGYPDQTFRPDGNITRAEFVTLLMKTKSNRLGLLNEQPFEDVGTSHWAAQYIKSGTDMGLVNGYPDYTFKPKQGINRAEGISIAARFGELDLNQNIYELPFKDLPGRHWAVKEINAANNAGFLKFLEGKPLEPKKDLSRAETAEILSHIKFIAEKIKNLMDFEKGYFEPSPGLM